MHVGPAPAATPSQVKLKAHKKLNRAALRAFAAKVHPRWPLATRKVTDDTVTPSPTLRFAPP
jgi:hypothetical protein